MFFDKKRYIVPIKGGKGSVNSEGMRGMTEQFIVIPQTEDTVWDLTLVDKESDELAEYKNHKGRLDDRRGLPLGKDKTEKVTISFTNVSRNEDIKVIFKIREIS